MNAFALRRFGVLSAIFSLLVIPAASSFAQPAAAAPAKDADQLPAISAGSAVLIVETPDGASSNESELLLQRRINTHVVSLRSQQYLRRMISSPNSEVRKTSWFTSAENPLERITWLHNHLRVKQVSGTAMIELSLTDVPDAKERRLILRELCDTYLTDAREIRMDQLGDRTKMLNLMRTKIELRLAQLTNEMHNRQIKLNSDGGGLGKIGTKEMELSRMISASVDAQLLAEKTEAEFNAMLQATKRGQGLSGTDAFIRDNQRISDLQRRLDDAEIRLEIAKARSNEPAPQPKDPLTKDPSAKIPSKDSAMTDIEVEVSFLQKKLERLTAETTAKAKVSLLEEAQTRALAAKSQFEGLQKKAMVLKDELGDLGNDMVTYNTLKEEDKGLREQLKTAREQIEQVMALQQTNAVVGIRWHIMPEVEVP